MAFVKVVGGTEIYYFGIQSSVHFSTKFWSKSISNRSKVLCTPSYARRSRWSCYCSISGITTTSLGGLSYKSSSAVRLSTPHRPAGLYCRRHRVLASPLAFTADQLVQHIP
jgi:hypothetical protein